MSKGLVMKSVRAVCPSAAGGYALIASAGEIFPHRAESLQATARARAGYIGARRRMGRRVGVALLALLGGSGFHTPDATRAKMTTMNRMIRALRVRPIIAGTTIFSLPNRLTPVRA